MTGKRARIAWIVVTILVVFALIRATGQGGRAGLGFFYTVPVGLATWWFGWRAGLAAVVACFGMLLLGAEITNDRLVSLPIALRSVALVSMWAGITAARHQAYELKLSRSELSAIRAALTPPALPEAAGVDVAASFVPVDHGVSGDFYLLAEAPEGKTVVVVGDVTGHGPDSARVATFVRASLASYAAHTAEPAEILMLANRAIAETASDSEFATAVCVAYDPASASLDWAIAGHPAPLRLPELKPLGPSEPGLPLGVDPDLTIVSNHAKLGKDEGLLLFTDGATEARAGSEFLGVSGLQDRLAPVGGLPAAELVAEAQRAVLEYSSEKLRDDLCILALKPAAD